MLLRYAALLLDERVAALDVRVDALDERIAWLDEVLDEAMLDLLGVLYLVDVNAEPPLRR